MSNLFDSILSMPEWAALLIVFALPALEASAFVGFVFPGEIAVILGGVLASQHKVGLVPVVVLAVAGAVSGDAVGYFVGKRWGRQFLERTLGRIPLVGHHIKRSLPHAQAYLARRGASAVFFGRWTAALRVLVPGLAGMAGVRYRTFAIFNFLGGLAWAITFVLLGYAAGRSYKKVEHWAGRIGLLLLMLIVVVGVILAIGRWVARHPERVRAVWDRQLSRPRVARFRARYRREIAFTLNRFRPGTAAGLSLTVSFVLIGLASWAAGVIGQDVVANQDLTRIDLPVKHFFDAHRTAFATASMKVLTQLGSTLFIVPVFLAIALIWRWRRKTWVPLVMFVASIGGVSLLRFIVGQLVERPRPASPLGLGPFTGPSFPSGHTVKAVAAYGMLAALYSRATRSWARRVGVWMGALIVALVVGFTRLYLGAHWLTDVLGAYALGTAWLFALLFALGAVRGRGKQLREPEPVPAPIPPEAIEPPEGEARTRPSEGEWPEVRTDGPAPSPGGVSVEEGTILLGQPVVVAHGLVSGIPWSIQAWTTAPAPGAKWWDVMQAVGPEMEFRLGANGFLGGGGIPVRVPEGHAFTASGHFFGRFPDVISWAGVVTEDVERLEVRLADGRSRDVRLHRGPEGVPPFFWFFPPRGVPAEIVVYDREDRVLERRGLPEPETPPETTAGTSVNTFGWRAGGPPPGWPQDEREFAPGEGPRREDDFLLHIAPFPIFVVPPDAWEGPVSLAGHSGHGGPASYVPTLIQFEYLDRVGDPTRGMHVVSVDPQEEDRQERAYPPHREEGLWWFDTEDDAASLPQLPGRFRRERDHTLGQGAGAAWGRRYVGEGRLLVGGSDTVFERREYKDYPELIEIRFRLPGVAIRMEGWNLGIEEMLDFAGRLEPLELGSDFLQRMTEAGGAAAQAWEAWHRERHPHAWPS